MSWQFGNRTIFLLIFVQNNSNFPKFNFSTDNLARPAGAICVKWKSRTFVNVGRSRICSPYAFRSNVQRVHLAPPGQVSLQIWWCTYGGRQGWRIFHFIQHSGQSAACSFGHDTTKPRWKDWKQALKVLGRLWDWDFACIASLPPIWCSGHEFYCRYCRELVMIRPISRTKDG